MTLKNSEREKNPESEGHTIQAAVVKPKTQ
jgi:hypothetical protein